MDILLCNKFFYEKGGAERYFFSLSRALEERGHRAIHFSMHHPDNVESTYRGYFVKEKRYDDSLGAWEALSQGVSFIRSREAAKRMKELVTDQRPQIAHLHNIYHQITPSIVPVLKRAGVPIVMTLHDYKLICPNYTLFARGTHCNRCIGGKFHQALLARCNGGSLTRSALLALEAYWQKWTHVYDAIRLFISPSRFLMERFIDAGFSPERVIHLPSFVHDDIPRAKEASEENRLLALPGKYVLYFGRLSEEKGLFSLLDALKQCDNVTLVFAGDGPLFGSLKGCAESHGLDVHFMGYVQKPALDRIIENARAVVLPSLWPENAPFTVLEAASLGVPVIVSDMGGLPEMAELLGGIVFPSGDSGSLAEKITRIWSDDALADRMGRNASNAVERQYRKDVHIDALETIYHSVL
ncbi:MAG: glycosyltransferase [Candidatus Latescibacteria bacterium]|nr:glycosyltransferase [Candidatus Latescibacterota bacterium]NIM20876.1 glycosyltransferase [Candidatus Latescibacterota bacterium]NIM65011.1 glycosyltransferase [Candidatus Latescibacterota bacterium]NIO01526.1 glycosyltransferase [Candidatus Latescibacterota bacterium]NIO28043.1 glycosyltransferase [Candidatus Latescibacterota bacterium]